MGKYDELTKDELKEKLAEKFDLVKNVEGEPEQELQWDKLVEDATEEIDALVEKRIQEKIDAQPVYRQPGEAVALENNLEAVKGTRYYRLVKDIAKDGYSRVGNRKVKQQDIWLAHYYMDEANRREPGKYRPPSEDLTKAVKALDTSTDGSGQDLVAEENARFLWDDFYLSSRVVANMPNVIDPMPVDPWPVPLGLGDVTWRKGTQNQATTPTDVATSESTLTTTELVAEVNWSYSLDEDAVVAFMPALRARLAISGGEMMDDFALNADSTATATGNINSDDATPASDAYYLSAGQDGIRHQWLVDGTSVTPDTSIDAGGDALTDADFSSMFGGLAKYAMDSNLIVTDVTTYLKSIRTLDSVFTVDKYGPGAVVLTGELGRYLGVPIIVSASHPRTMADGKVSATAANNTLGQISAFNAAMWYVGFKRGMLVEVDRDIRTRQMILVASFREAIAAHGTRASNYHTAGIFNIL